MRPTSTSVPLRRDRGLVRSVRLGCAHQPARERRLAGARGRLPRLGRRRSAPARPAAAPAPPAAGERLPPPTGEAPDRRHAGRCEEVRGDVRALRSPRRLIGFAAAPAAPRTLREADSDDRHVTASTTRPGERHVATVVGRAASSTGRSLLSVTPTRAAPRSRRPPRGPASHGAGASATAGAARR
jgi:hypothetical protein